MKKKLTKRSAVYAGQSGSVRVRVYLRSQIKNGIEYVNYAVADYSSGKRKFWTFGEFDDAKKKANDLAKAIAKGQTVGQDWSSLQRIEINQALEICKEVGVGLLPALTIFREAIGLLDGNQNLLLTACNAWKRTEGTAPFTPVIVTKATADFCARQTRVSVRRKRTIESLMRTFSGRFGGCFMHEVAAAELQDFIASKPWAPKSVNDFLGAISQLYTDSQLRGGVPPSFNPTKSIKRLKIKAAAIGVFQPWEARQILARIDTNLVPFLAIWLFSGCRKEEASRLSWQQVNRALETGYFELFADQTKTGNTRLVPVENNLRLWLLANRKESGSILPPRWRSNDPLKAVQRLDELSKYISRKTGVVWVDNGPRHSFGTYHLKFHQDVGLTTDSMGTSIAKFERHYRSRDKLITKELATEWFGIAPGEAASVINIPGVEAA